MRITTQDEIIRIITKKYKNYIYNSLTYKGKQGPDVKLKIKSKEPRSRAGH